MPCRVKEQHFGRTSEGFFSKQKRCAVIWEQNRLFEREMQCLCFANFCKKFNISIPRHASGK